MFTSFKSKAVSMSAGVLIALTAALIVYFSVKFLSYNDSLVNEKTVANVNLFKSWVNDCGKYSQTAAVSMAGNPYVVKAVKNRGRQEILNTFLSSPDLYNIDYYSITDESGIVLARTHDPDNFGDTILNRQDIQNALNGKVTTYFETGANAKVTLLTGAPVFDTAGTLIGVVSAGIRFDNSEVIAKRFNSEIAVSFGDTGIINTLTEDFVSACVSELKTKAGVWVKNSIFAAVYVLFLSIAILYTIISSLIEYSKDIKPSGDTQASGSGSLDKLTGLASKQAFEARLNLEWNRAMRDGSSLSFLIINVDKFKEFNDTYGSKQGDAALRTVAKVLTQTIKRATDLSGRWSGEEFTVLMPNTGSDNAMIIAEQLRRAVENTEIECINKKTSKKVTISIGVNMHTPALGGTVGNFISKADEALCHAKESGRNRVCLQESEVEV